MRDLLLTAIVTVLLPFCFMQPWIGFLTWTWIGTMNPHRIVFGFAQSIPWAMIVGGVALLGLLVTKDRKPVPWNTQLVLMVILLVYFTFTTLFAWAPTPAWEQWDRVVKLVIMAIIATKVIYGRDRIRWLLLVIALSIGYYGVKGGIWTILTGGAERVHGPTQSFISQSNGIGLGLVMVIPIIAALAREEKRKWFRWGLIATAGLCVLSTIFTYSRGAMLGLAMIALLMFMRAKRKVLISLMLAPVIAAGVAFAPEKVFDRAESIGSYSTDSSSMQRLLTWSVAWNIAADRPLTGAGFSFESSPNLSRWASYADPDLVQYMKFAHAAHSIYFQVLGQHGFVGFTLFMLLLFSTLWKLGQLRKEAEKDPECEWIANYASALRICLLGYMVAGAFLSTAYFDVAWVYCTFTALLARELAGRSAARKTAVPPPRRGRSSAEGNAPGSLLPPRDTGYPGMARRMRD